MISADAPAPALLQLKWRIFVGSIAAVTLVPLVVFPASVHFNTGVVGLAVLASVLNFLGSGVHVASTGFFYTDPEVRDFFRQHRWRYVFAPALLVILSGVVFYFTDRTISAYLILAYFAWQTYHYQKQNYGILCFAIAASDRTHPSPLEKFILQLAVWIGIVGLIKPYGLARYTAFERFSDAIHRAAAGAVWIIPVLLIAAFATLPALRRNPLRLACLLMGAVFYVPLFLFDNPVAAVSGYAVAHGLQYLVFMYFVSRAGSKPVLRLSLLLGIALAGGTLLAITGGQTFLGTPPRIIFGCYLGLVMSHFVIDAGIWKLRDPFPRKYVGRAFDFVFSRGRQSGLAQAPSGAILGDAGPAAHSGIAPA